MKNNALEIIIICAQSQKCPSRFPKLKKRLANKFANVSIESILLFASATPFNPLTPCAQTLAIIKTIREVKSPLGEMKRKLIAFAGHWLKGRG